MKKQPMETAPKDRPILLMVDDSWIGAQWNEEIRKDGTKYGDGFWCPVRLPSHGCGCCSDEDPQPTAWSELPS